jgi:transcription elongation GreA/GreB family factor
MFLWAARQFFADKYAALALEIAPHEIIREMAEFIKDLQNQVDHGVPNAPTLRGTVVKLKNFLAEDHYEILRHAITPLPVADARAVCRLFESHAAFPDSYLASLRHAAQEVRPDIEETAETMGPLDLDEAVLYVSVESYQRRNAELQHLRTIEIPKNSREIGEAASHGDLSENAEYEAAHHRQRILFKRAEELQKEIERARVIERAWVRSDCVWVSTRFQARNLKTGEIETYSILGAWDGKPEENALSYLTPAASQFLRRKVGDKVTVQRPNDEPTTYEIVAIENAMA